MSIRIKRKKRIKTVVNGETLPEAVDQALQVMAEYPYPQVVWLSARSMPGRYSLRWSPEPDLLGHTWGGFLIITAKFERYCDVVRRARKILRAELRRKGVESEGNARSKSNAAKMAV